jgi:molybdate-binding protein/DNA-binding XRE family transcriptional regulator
MPSKGDHTTPGEPRVHSRLAAFRRKRGMAAAGLARASGVSRQTIYAIEAGDYLPNTAVALRLASALETRVEDLFQLDAVPLPPSRTAQADLIGAGDLLEGSPVELCRVDGRLVGVPAAPAPWQMVPAGARLSKPPGASLPLRGSVRFLRADGEAEDAHNHLLLAGCDPAASLLARRLLRSGVELVTAQVNSSAALRLLHERLVHVAGTHLKDESGDEPNRSAIGAAFPRRGVAVFTFASWEEGLVVARGNPKAIRAIEDLARPGVTLANRERGSGSRQLLDRCLNAAGISPRAVGGYRSETTAGHLAAAWRVRATLADCCVATSSAARAFGLDFVPLATERYDLVMRRERLELASVVRLLDVIAQGAFRRELEALCGYDARDAARRIA